MPEHTGDDTHGTRFALDRHLLRRRFDRAAARCDSADLLAREIARRMDERLDYIRVTPRRVLDLGCGTGADLPRLAERFPDDQLSGLFQRLADFLSAGDFPYAGMA